MNWRYLLVMLALGVGWGATQPLGKIATATGHPPFGLIFWQLVICTLVLGAVTFARGKRLLLHRRALMFYAVVALVGTLIPNYTFYTSIARLPSGIMSILVSTIPMQTFALALALGMDRFAGLRLAGLGFGLAGVLVIALPGVALPEPAMVAFLPLAMVGPLFYAMEGNFVARFGMAGMDPVQAMFGASLAGVLLCLPVTLALGQWISPALPYGRAEVALIGSSALHAVIYAGYVGLAAKAGATYAAQVSYIVTGAGVVWAMVLLGERFSPMVWAAAALMLIGLMLVQPRGRVAPA